MAFLESPLFNKRLHKKHSVSHDERAKKKGGEREYYLQPFENLWAQKRPLAEDICQVALKEINKQTADDDDREMVGVAPTTFQVLCTYQGRDHFFRQEVWSGREEVKTRHVIPLFSTCTIVYSVFPTLTTKIA